MDLKKLDEKDLVFVSKSFTKEEEIEFSEHLKKLKKKRKRTGTIQGVPGSQQR
ncbi:MAG: hypothetical protein QM669_12405 [Siphonobacter sp.]